MKVTLGDTYKGPVYIEIFADHFHAPWYEHYSISKDGLEKSLTPSKMDSYLKGGESTGWINISNMVYQDSGALLLTTVRENYPTILPLDAKFEIATAPSDKAIVKTITRKADPGCITIVFPPDWTKGKNVTLLTDDLSMANATGKIADKHQWSSFGKSPKIFPF
ncbi:MAG: hypothetical protein ABI254_12905, partial [Chthoniobacterales bacterium]